MATSAKSKSKVTVKSADGSSLKGLSGKAATRGKQFDPTDESIEALSASLEELKISRPYASRYPINDARFNKLKEAAHKSRRVKKNASMSPGVISASFTDKRARTSVAINGLA